MHQKLHIINIFYWILNILSYNFYIKVFRGPEFFFRGERLRKVTLTPSSDSIPVHAKHYTRLSSSVDLQRHTCHFCSLCSSNTLQAFSVFSLHIWPLFSHKTFFPLSFERSLRSSSSDGAAAKDQAALAVGAERKVLRQHQRGFSLTLSTSHKSLWCVTGWAYLSNLKHSHTCHLPELYTYHYGKIKFWMFAVCKVVGVAGPLVHHLATKC